MLSGDRGTQPSLLPLDVRDLLPAEHLVWQILAFVDELDLHRFHAGYRADGRGRPPYDPATMLALILYCAAKNIRGSRAVEAACTDDLGCRVITGHHRPDHSTINRFLNEHTDALRGLLPQTLRLCHDGGLIDLDLIAGDGTKVQANAAMDNTVDLATLQQQITGLHQQITDTEAQWRAGLAHTPEPAGPSTLFDPDPDPDPDPDLGLGLGLGLGPDRPAPGTPTDGLTVEQAWRRLGVLTRTLHARQVALAHLSTRPSTDRSEWEARLARDTARVADCQNRVTALHTKLRDAYDRRQAAEAAGAVFLGPRPVDPDQHSQLGRARAALAKATTRAETTAANPPTTGKINTTDLHSRIMPGKHGGYDQLYNLQATATARQIILAVTLHDSPNDKQALTGLLATTRANLDAAGITQHIGVALFDSGYASTDNFTAELPVELLLVAVEKEARQTGRLNDEHSTAATAWQDMTTRLAEPANHTRYQRRGAIIEPVFAQLFNHFGHNLHHRGAEHVETELHIWATSHNLAKLIRHRRATRTTHPPR